jgi:hypothetical protein
MPEAPMTAEADASDDEQPAETEDPTGGVPESEEPMLTLLGELNRMWQADPQVARNA